MCHARLKTAPPCDGVAVRGAVGGGGGWGLGFKGTKAHPVTVITNGTVIR